MRNPNFQYSYITNFMFFGKLLLRPTLFTPPPDNLVVCFSIINAPHDICLGVKPLKPCLVAEKFSDLQKMGSNSISAPPLLKKISVLSGGEKSRVLLGKVLAAPANLERNELSDPVHSRQLRVRTSRIRWFVGAQSRAQRVPEL